MGRPGQPRHPGRIVTCACGCGRVDRHKGRGLISACWNRERYHGRIDDWPPTKQPATHRMKLRADTVRGRLEDYLELRSWGVDDDEAAARLGVTTRTLTRYKAHLRATGAIQEESTAA